VIASHGDSDEEKWLIQRKMRGESSKSPRGSIRKPRADPPLIFLSRSLLIVVVVYPKAIAYLEKSKHLSFQDGRREK